MDFIINLPSDIVIRHILPKLDSTELVHVLKWVSEVEEELVDSDKSDKSSSSSSSTSSDDDEEINQITVTYSKIKLQMNILPTVLKMIAKNLSHIKVKFLIKTILDTQLTLPIIKVHMMEINSAYMLHNGNPFLRSYYSIFLRTIITEKAYNYIGIYFPEPHDFYIILPDMKNFNQNFKKLSDNFKSLSIGEIINMANFGQTMINNFHKNIKDLCFRIVNVENLPFMNLDFSKNEFHPLDTDEDDDDCIARNLKELFIYVNNARESFLTKTKTIIEGSKMGRILGYRQEIFGSFSVYGLGENLLMEKRVRDRIDLDEGEEDYCRDNELEELPGSGNSEDDSEQIPNEVSTMVMSHDLDIDETYQQLCYEKALNMDFLNKVLRINSGRYTKLTLSLHDIDYKTPITYHSSSNNFNFSTLLYGNQIMLFLKERAILGYRVVLD